MLVIRLQRVGKKNQASFRVVLQEKERSPKGKAKELLGFYNPETKEKAFQKERITYWMTKGAQPSPTVHNMFVDEGLITGAKVKAWQPKRKPKAEAPTEVKASVGEKSETPAEPAAEAPAAKDEEQPKAESTPVPEEEAPAAEQPVEETKKEEPVKEEEPAKEEPKPEPEAKVETKEEEPQEAEQKE